MTQLIVALDFASQAEVNTLIAKINPSSCALKIGSELFTSVGPLFVKKLVSQGYRIFLDLKFHDIPTTVGKACKAAADLGVWMLNLHASGGLTMMQKAKESLDEYGVHKPLLLAVTVLTSMNHPMLESIGIDSTIENQVNRLAALAREAQLDGVVCSAQEAMALKSSYGATFITVTPGIRLTESPVHDQSRIMTPIQAKNAGVDYIVMGRPITKALQPELVIEKVLASLT